MKLIQKSAYSKLATFNHKEHAERLDELNTQAQAARRIDVALGLYCFELKEVHLVYGQFGKWLAEHKPHLARVHDNGSAQPGRSLEAAMSIAKSALEVCGYQIGDFISLLQKSQFPRVRGNCNDAGQLMLLPPEKLPEEFKKLQEEIFALVDGKSKRQLLSEFKQVDEDGKKRRGQLPGSKGLTKEMREKAAQRAEQERLNELDETIVDRIEWLLEISDAKNLGAMDSKLLKRFVDAADTASGFAKRTLASRANEKGGQQ